LGGQAEEKTGMGTGIGAGTQTQTPFARLPHPCDSPSGFADHVLHFATRHGLPPKLRDTFRHVLHCPQHGQASAVLNALWGTAELSVAGDLRA